MRDLVADAPRTSATTRSLLLAILCITPLFFSLGNHAILGDSEARYGTIARSMARGESPLLIPHLFEQPHLTKPPLAYWLIAASMRCFGPNLWALRLPSAVSTSLTLLVLYFFARRVYTARIAWVAVGIAAVCPLVVVVGRLATTDAHLGLFSLVALLSGVLAVRERQRQWTVLLWFATALGLLTKGPAALLPILALLLWLIGQRQWALVKHLKPFTGIIGASLPLLLWSGYVVTRHDESWGVWIHETWSRATGEGDHPQPWWFFLPVALLGLWPVWLIAACFRPLPSAAPPTKALSPLWLTVIGLYLLVFSLMTGKLMSYLLPIAGPASLWAADRLSRVDSPAPARLAGVWLLLILAWMGGAVLEDRYAQRSDPTSIVETVQAVTSIAHPRIYTVGFIDRRLIWYTEQPTARIDPRILDPMWSAMSKRDMVLLAEPAAWAGFAADRNWDLGKRFEWVGRTRDGQGGREALDIYRTLPTWWENPTQP